MTTDDKKEPMPPLHPNTKTKAANEAERHMVEGLETLNDGLALGPNPRAHWPTRYNPNARTEGAAGKWRFIRGSGYYDTQRPISKKS